MLRSTVITIPEVGETQSEGCERGGSATTTKVSSRVVQVPEELYDRTTLRMIDTPGLPPGCGAVEDKERERGIAGLLRIMEDGFESVMREESRIVRRATRGEDDLIHLGAVVQYILSCRPLMRSAVSR
jgi:septin family protein